MTEAVSSEHSLVIRMMGHIIMLSRAHISYTILTALIKTAFIVFTLQYNTASLIPVSPCDSHVQVAISEDLRSTLNAFLYRTGESSRK